MLKWLDVLKYARNGNPEPPERVERTDEEWKARLSEEQYRITRAHGTEPAFTGAFCESFEPGIYACSCCGTLLFDASVKFESGTGWPSFTQPIEPNVVKYRKDNSWGMVRVEILCNVCDAHLGHVFPDGPPPSELRYCVNSLSLEKVREGSAE